jgi:hypothetical protein
VINNVDGVGEGFNDPTPAAVVGGNYGTTLGQQRLIAFTYAANLWAACLQSNVTITVRARMDPQFCDAGSAILGSAGATTVHANFAGAPLANTLYPQALANALFGADLHADPDIDATFNSNLNGAVGCLGGIKWYYGLNATPPGGDIDFVTVVLHEIGHGLGFQTFVNAAGQKFAGLNDHYMIFLENHFAVPATYPAMSDAQRAAANIADPNLHWIGALVTARGAAILGGGISNGHVRMHGPNPYQNGSSVSHWSSALSPNELMEPVYAGPNHDPRLAWTLMDEIGWTLVNKVTDGCEAATVDLLPPNGTISTALGGGIENFNQRGAYVTALKDFSLCSVGVEAAFVVGDNITASVYAATGTARGALLATNTVKVEFDGVRTHYIPLAFNLKECTDYDIAVTWDHLVSFRWWNENTMTTRPYDVGGTVRVRDSESAGGDASNFALLHFTLQGSSSSPDKVSILENSPFGNCNDAIHNRGAFIKAAKTISVCKVGFEAFYNTPGILTANIYNAAGLVRGSLLATGQLNITSFGSLVYHNIPVNALLQEGRDYEIEILYPAGYTVYGCQGEGGAPVAYTVDNAITVVNGTGNGDPANTIIPHMSVSWNEGPGLNALDITLPFLGAPDGISGVNTLFGKYVTALHDQELTGLGFYADIVPGGTLVANVYAAAGTVRGALISTGSVVTGPAGTRWHDIPVSAHLVNGQNYDLEINWSATTSSFPYWIAVGAGQPYNAYGHLTVIVGEQNGTVDPNTECAQYRIFSCRTGTLTASGPAVTPKFAIHSVYPNPFSGTTTLGYELDEATRVTVQVYDVAGRRVADIVQSKAMPAGPGEMQLDASKLSSGVYFVKMSTPTKSVTRKIAILR